jgi:hypothetical protein
MKNVEKSMSRGRKIFRFMKWLDDIKEIYYYIIYKSTSLRNIFKAMMCMSSFFYHVFDNLVWFNNVGLMSEYFVGDIKLKNAKNLFSLLRNIIKIVLDILKFNYLYYLDKQNEEEVFEIFEQPVENFKPDDLDNKILKQALEIRAKYRAKLLDIIHSFLRICTLLYSLRLEPFYSNVHPIFTNFCGMAQSIIALYKALFVKNKDIKEFEYAHNDEMKKGKKKSNLQAILRDEDHENDHGKLLMENSYFENYYIDFNKDFPTEPKEVLLNYIS